MDFQITISPDKRYIVVKPLRDITMELATGMALASGRAAKEQEINAVLLDVRGRQSLTSPSEKFQFAHEETSKIGIPRTAKYAFLADDAKSSFGFMETVMGNAGFYVKIFADEKQAIAWLTSEDSE